MPFDKEGKRYFPFTISFSTEEDRENFKDYLHNVKTSRQTPIYQTATEMMELHREINKKKR